MVQRPLASILPDEELLGAISSAIEDPMSHSNEARSFDIVPSSKERSWVATFTLMESDTKPTLGAIIVLRDMTKAREIEKLKSDFIMAASHELRTPVTSIGMSIDLLEESNAERLTQPGREMLRTAKSEVRRLRELVEDLLNLSRIEAGKIEIRRERVSVHRLFQQVQDIFAPQCAMKHVTLIVDAATDCEDIAADQGKIAWVLTNLVSNALRYTPEHGRIQMDARNAGAMVEITVRDTGPGIPYEYQSRIFERFVQFQHGGSAGGAGLGLAIAKEIVKAHGGTIWVDSVPGNGSTFTFTIASMPMERS
jgi:NtrC-family two-component system sensor histidine kinase KinB